MRRSLATLAAIAFAAALPASAHAAGPLYLTGAILNASTELDAEAEFKRLFDDDDDGWSLGVGFHISKHLAIEGTYHDLGTAAELSECDQPDVACIALIAPGEVDSTALAVSVLPHWPLTKHLSIYGRVGLATWESDIRESFAGASLETIDDEDLILGLGLRLEVLGPFGAFAELNRIADTFETVSLGASLGF